MRRTRLRSKLKVVMLVLGLVLGMLWFIPGNVVDAQDQIEPVQQVNTYENKSNISEQETTNIINRPEYYVSLSENYQQLIYDLCFKNDLSYELVLAVFYQESKFNPEAVSKSRDIGLSQISSYYKEVYRDYAIEYCDLPKEADFDLYNVDHNIRAGIGGLVYLRNYYKGLGISDEVLFNYVLGSYNQGVSGYESYLKRNRTTETTYAKRIFELKSKLETNGSFE